MLQVRVGLRISSRESLVTFKKGFGIFILVKIPADHIKALQSHLGNEYDDFVSAYETTGPTSIRINPIKWREDFIKPSVVAADNVKWCENGYYLQERPSFTHDPLFHAGCYYVQEASSQFLSHVAKIVFRKEAPLKVLDLCAAPGGKSTLLATELSDDSLLVSNEVIRTRAHILAENISKWGKANVVVTNSDPENFSKLKGFFDVIVIDAPCSGEGLFRRDPELTKEWSPENVNLCSSRQRRIVLDTWSSLKEGGLIVYSTCTFNKQENEENLSWLRTQVEFDSVKLDIPSDWNIVQSVTKLGNVEPGTVNRELYAYRFYPHRVKGEGFFISVLRKTESQEASSSREKVLFTFCSSKEKNEVAPWFSIRSAPDVSGRTDGANEILIRSAPDVSGRTDGPNELSGRVIDEGDRIETTTREKQIPPEQYFDFIRRGDHILALPKIHTESIHKLTRALNCVQYGIPVANTGKGMKPLHELAISNHLNKDAFHQTELSREDALKFLAKEDVKDASMHKGISLMTYQGVPIGWMNLLGNRANNLYPKDWRIRRL